RKRESEKAIIRVVWLPLRSQLKITKNRIFHHNKRQSPDVKKEAKASFYIDTYRGRY
ncbi:hypothetical protein VIBRN418_14261, partial [Vibrio sp. N418]